MEYEISDEDVLFDDSTNPSLDRKREPAQLEPPVRLREQKAVPIPEEEQQFA